MKISEKIKFKIDIKNITHIAKEIAKNKKVKAVYLFGSQAKGKTHIHSDVDICIITESEAEDIAYHLTDNLDVSYFHNLPLIIQYRVLKEGRPLIVKDREFMHHITMKTLHDYIEFRPAILRFIRETYNV